MVRVEKRFITREKRRKMTVRIVQTPTQSSFVTVAHWKASQRLEMRGYDLYDKTCTSKLVNTNDCEEEEEEKKKKETQKLMKRRKIRNNNFFITCNLGNFVPMEQVYLNPSVRAISSPYNTAW